MASQGDEPSNVLSSIIHNTTWSPVFRQDRPGISTNVERTSYENIYLKREGTWHGCARFPQPLIKDQTAGLASTARKGHS